VKAKKWVTISVTLRTITVDSQAYVVKHVLRIVPGGHSSCLFSSVPERADIEAQSTILPRLYSMQDVAETIGKHHLELRKVLRRVRK
jgi:hypothetical protein